MRRAGGRPTKLTPEIRERIVAAIRAGNYAQVAAGFAGIGESTFYRWMQEGEGSESGEFREFWEAVRGAESEAEVRAVAIIHSQMAQDWRAALTYLERKFPGRWARRERVDVTSGDKPVTTGVLVVPRVYSSAAEWEQAVAKVYADAEKAAHP